MLIALVRHGQTDFNLKELVQGQIDNPLNSTGEKQALESANKLKNSQYQFNKIAASTLSRALQTAHIINEHLKIDNYIYSHPIFMERDFSYFDGTDIHVAFKQIKEKEPDEGYEKDRDLLVRAHEALHLITQKFKDQNVLLATHSHFIKAVLQIIDPNRFDFFIVLKMVTSSSLSFKTTPLKSLKKLTSNIHFSQFKKDAK